MRDFCVEKVLERARNSISKFCTQECKAYCCRNGFLSMDSKAIALIPEQKRRELEQKGALHNFNNIIYTLLLTGDNCPHLKNLKCKIHMQPDRPIACKLFPIFIYERTIMFSNRCLAVKQGVFYPLMHRLKQKGYTVYESDPMLDSDFYKIIK